MLRFQTQNDVAKFFDREVRTIRRWVSAGMPKPPCRMVDVVRWRLAGVGDDDLRQQQQAADLKLTSERCRQLKIENDREADLTCSRADVERWAAKAFADLRDTLMGIPDAIANSIEPHHQQFVREEVDRHARNALHAFAAKLDEYPNDKRKAPSDE